MPAEQMANLGPYADPMAEFVSQPALSTETIRLRNNKRYYSPSPSPRTKEDVAAFPAPIVNMPNAPSSVESGYDAHIYYETDDPVSYAYAKRLHSAIRHRFPNHRVYQMLDGPAGPHPTATFEVAIFSPNEFAELVPWLTIWHGPLSVLIHTNTEVSPVQTDAEGDARAVNDHTIRALWLGKPWPLNTKMLGGGSGGGPGK